MRFESCALLSRLLMAFVHGTRPYCVQVFWVFVCQLLVGRSMRSVCPICEMLSLCGSVFAFLAFFVALQSFLLRHVKCE